jgi:hypothetical protein
MTALPFERLILRLAQGDEIVIILMLSLSPFDRLRVRRIFNNTLMLSLSKLESRLTTPITVS